MLSDLSRVWLIKEAAIATTTTTATVELVRVDEPLGVSERAAIAGFLAGYSGNTLISQTTDLRLFVRWCTNDDDACSTFGVPIWRSSDARCKPTVGCAPPSPAGRRRRGASTGTATSRGSWTAVTARWRSSARASST